MVKPRFEKNIETAYIYEQCGTARLRHRITLIDGTVVREKYWAADRLSCCGESMKLRTITFNMLEPTKCHTCANKACPYPTDGEFGVQWAKGGAAWQENKDCWRSFEVAKS
jgi:hypothetical protein